jgi:hypothetical protein
MKKLLASVFCLALSGTIFPANAADPEMCLDCHEPAEDWVDLSREEILETAADAEIKRHADNTELSSQELEAIVDELLPKNPDGES